MGEENAPACPATMCPLFAKDGSPWTGTNNAPCPGHSDLNCGGCPWWDMGCSEGGPMEQVVEADAHEGRMLVLGPSQPRRLRAAPRTYDCPKASGCQWQIRAGDKLCPPREALARGLDPRVAAF